MPAISAEHAAAMVVRGLVEKPVRIDTPLGTLSDVGHYFTPKLSRRVLHQLYLGYPDSAAARGVTRRRRLFLHSRTPARRRGAQGRPPAPSAPCGCRGRSSRRCDGFPACTGSTRTRPGDAVTNGSDR